jgi:hypothetical protein
LVVLNASGAEVSGATMIAAERLAHQAQCGAMSPAMCEKFSKLSPSTVVRFFAYPRSVAPDLGPRPTEPVSGELEARNAIVLNWAASTRQVVKDAMIASGLVFEVEDPSSPLVFGRGPLDRIAVLASDERVELIEHIETGLELYSYPSVADCESVSQTNFIEFTKTSAPYPSTAPLDVVAKTVRADDFRSAGVFGTNVSVGVVDALDLRADQSHVYSHDGLGPGGINGRTWSCKYANFSEPERYVDSAAHKAHHGGGAGQRLSCERERFLRLGSPVA